MFRVDYLNSLIECRKQGHANVHEYFCDTTKCAKCPYFLVPNCCEVIYDDLIDIILDLHGELEESSQETNLEHYYYAYDYLSTTQNLDDVYERITVEFKKGAYDSYTKSNVGIIDWLLSPYEPPKKSGDSKMMKIGDEVLVHGYVDEIRKDVVIIKNEGGYFGTAPSEIRCEKTGEVKE